MTWNRAGVANHSKTKIQVDGESWTHEIEGEELKPIEVEHIFDVELLISDPVFLTLRGQSPGERVYP